MIMAKKHGAQAGIPGFHRLVERQDALADRERRGRQHAQQRAPHERPVRVGTADDFPERLALARRVQPTQHRDEQHQNRNERIAGAVRFVVRWAKLPALGGRLIDA
ncbi:hypothetical protein, partial [Rhodothermus marinus]|uniref:hypothetical protein n=1 Tax=Rhodothermus marinus TaxID=29549 RepID=UPI001FB24E39